MDYLKPIRRKLGVVTLVMACVFMAGWVRSHSFVTTWSSFSRQNVSQRQFDILRVLSTDLGLEWQRLWRDSDASEFSMVSGNQFPTTHIYEHTGMTATLKVNGIEDGAGFSSTKDAGDRQRLINFESGSFPTGQSSSR